MYLQEFKGITMQSRFCTERVSIYDSHDSSYDYTIYDLGFVFVDEDDDEEFTDEFYYVEIPPTGMGGNVH